VLCGVLDTPHRELPDSEVISFARDSRARLRPERGSERDEAELGVVARLRELGYRDAFRSLHGYAHREPSWTWRRIAGHDGGWRLDHLFASEELHPFRRFTTTHGVRRYSATTRRLTSACRIAPCKFPLARAHPGYTGAQG
jgi:exonuclease III